MPGGNAEKGQRYIASLDQARAQGKWDDVPELIRKVTKHAPQRTCVIQTATAELRVVAFLQQRTTTSDSTSTPHLPELIPALLTTIENNDGNAQELLQAQVCLGWIHWTLNEPSLAAARLPRDFNATVDTLTSDGQSLSPWTEVCLVKGCYLKGSAQSAVAEIDEILETFASLAVWLENGQLASSTNQQFLNWSETMLARGALIATETATNNSPYSDSRHVEIALRLYRLWASIPPSTMNKYVSADNSGALPRPAIYKAYYGFLTTILQNGLVYTPPIDAIPERPQLASEFRRIESICESNLLREVKFPTAQSNNSQVEEWVEQVISNWEVLCGPHWQDQDLGEGGQNAVGRNVLDILYRAATKTYHSHLILRRLFHVHSALADFDLAVKALESYIEIVTAAKERAAKGAESGELEKDEILLQTLSEGVSLLSCLGSFDEAEKAKDLTELIREYLNKQDLVQENGNATGNTLLTGESNTSDAPGISQAVLALANRAVGIGLANWANYTPQNETRDLIRGEAIDYLERSVSPELGNQLSYASLYTLSLVLAENRDLDNAINSVKSALTSNKTMSSEDLSQERDLVPLWHLLALLLSAKQEFDIAERSCEAAFEQFPSDIFPRSTRERRSSRQSHCKDHGSSGPKRSLLSRLSGREKERIIQTRISQLAFVELLEGPEAAVNQTEQLLSLFSTLFNDLNLDNGSAKAKPENLVPPKSSAGTAKSFRSSIFSRNRSSQLPDRRADPTGDAPAVPPIPNGHSTPTGAPAIHITDEDVNTPQENQSPLSRSDSKKLRKRSGSFHSKNEKSREQEPPLPNGAETPDMVGIAVSGNVSPATPTHSPGGKQPLQPIAHNIHHKQQPAPAGHERQPPVQDTRLPRPHRFDSPTNAITKFSTLQSNKHALGLLVKIWLIIAGLYRRASLFDDAREACEEAAKQTARVEIVASTHESSARTLSKRGWCNAKSSEELWADVYAEQGLLSQAQSKPHQAIKQFEDALLRFPDHPTATISLANLLLDVWDQTLPLEPSTADVNLDSSRVSLLSELSKPKSVRAVSTEEMKITDDAKSSESSESPTSAHNVDPKHLHRLAARDRAYGLLSALTKLGSSWDNSDAWYALSRAYEAGEQTQKLKEVLWWCIELEDRRPIRHWSNIGSGLYVL